MGNFSHDSENKNMIQPPFSKRKSFYGFFLESTSCLTLLQGPPTEFFFWIYLPLRRSGGFNAKESFRATPGVGSDSIQQQSYSLVGKPTWQIDLQV